MVRTSSYTIYVDLPGNGGEMLLVHGYNGAFDKVSRRVATYLRSREARRPPRPLYGDWTPEETPGGEVRAPSDETLELLRRRGYLTHLTAEEEEGLFARVVEKIHHGRLAGPPHYIVMPTYDCNLRCAYCFQDHLRTDVRHRHLLKTMDRAMAERVFSAMRRLEERHGVSPESAFVRRITFFGGEPLLAESRDIVEHIIRTAQDLGEARFDAITNGTDLEVYRDLLGPEGISELQITLDGPPAEHDRRRGYADGGGTFERIARNLDMALERGVKVKVRMNVDRLNVDELPRLADEIVARGWHERRGFVAYAAPIHAEGGPPKVKTTMSMWDLNQALAELRREHPSMAVIMTSDDPVRQQAERVFSRDASYGTVKSSFCGAHTTMYIFDALGDVYACWERTGDPNVRIGHVTAEGDVVLEDGLLGMWRRRTVASNPVCRKCRYALHCGGGCAVLALAQSGKFFKNYCDGFASRFRSNVAEAFTKFLAGETAGGGDVDACGV